MALELPTSVATARKSSVGVDSESYYDDDIAIGTLGVRRYCRESPAYMYSAYGDQFAVVGHRREFIAQTQPYANRKDVVVVAHNAAYDSTVFNETGVIPPGDEWKCSADLSVYLQAPRDLKHASKVLLGLDIDKSVRDNMKGVRYETLPTEAKIKLAEYCLTDAKLAKTLWDKYADQWPAHEQAASDHTRLMCQRGIGVNLDTVEAGINALSKVMWDCERTIPWAGQLSPKGEPMPITSGLLIAKQCRMLGVTPPTSTDVKSEAWAEWEEENADKAPFVAAVQKWRRANRLLSVLTAFKTRTIDGTLAYSLKYGGAPHTLRWSGDNALNMQNLPRKPFEDVDARACLVPRAGKKFVIADFSQIEARVALWIAKEAETLKLLRTGIDLYEAHARATKGYSDSRPLKQVDPDLRQLCKCEVLALGFGVGAAKFQKTIKSWTGMDVSETRCKTLVQSFRSRHRGITGLWTALESGARDSIGGTFEMVLPSGRVIRYFNVAEVDGRLSASVERGKHPHSIYSGKLFENLVQATARDLFALAVLRLEAAGFPVVLHCHDEVVVETEQSADPREVVSIMCQLPNWAQGLPITAEAASAMKYGK